MATIALKRTGQRMPLVGFGLWKVDKSTCADTVYDAIKAGYRLLDGACDYGNEKEAGEGVRRAIAEGLVKREDLFITSKARSYTSYLIDAPGLMKEYQLWNTFHAHDHVKQIAEKQLQLWEIGYFDLFLVHFPISLQYVDPEHRFPPEWRGDDGKVHLQDTPLSETWGAMEELVDEKLVKNIGLSNCRESIILDVSRYAKYEPQVLQVELHPYLTQKGLVDLCKTLGIAVTAYSSFGPQSYLELDMAKGSVSLLEHDVITNVAAAHRKTTAQVLLRWATQRGIAVIPKSNHYERLVSNLQCDGFDLSDAEVARIDELNINRRFNDPADIDPCLGIFA